VEVALDALEAAGIEATRRADPDVARISAPPARTS